MTAPSEEIARKVNNWADFADEDLRLARHTLELLEPCPFRLAAYHAQQCVEKYLKAFLVLRGIDFPFTHNIARLLEMCSKESAWAEGLQEAEELTPFAISTRYPGEDESVTENEARRAIDIADRVRTTVRTVLVAEGVIR